jgi:hypothetical protein
MIYKVSGLFIPAKKETLKEWLSNGTIRNQSPDGEHIYHSLKHAKINENNRTLWFSECYCNTPLAHERETVFDLFFEDLQITQVEQEHTLEGTSFFKTLGL